MIADHEVEKLAGFRAHLPVHALGLCYQLLGRADGVRISLREQEGFVVIAQAVNPQAEAMLFPDRGHGRGDDVPDLGTESGRILLRIVKAPPLQVGQVRIAVKAQLFRHAHAQANQLVILGIQLGADAFVQARPGQEGFLPLRPVRALHGLQQAVEVALFPAEVRDGHRAVFLVTLADLPFPDGFLDDPLVRGF